MGEVIATFADGRLLVQESKLCDNDYVASGMPFRIGGIKTILYVISVDSDYNKLGVVIPLTEVKIGTPISGRGAFSGTRQELYDNLRIVMRRGDLPLGSLVSAQPIGISGCAALNLMSGLTSGLAWLGEVLSGKATSGIITVTANVIGIGG